jgi:hypothetical protein
MVARRDDQGRPRQAIQELSRGPKLLLSRSLREIARRNDDVGFYVMCEAKQCLTDFRVKRRTEMDVREVKEEHE